MNFELQGAGRSFKGAFAYYLHDKRQDPAGPHLTTAERVAWMEVRNLAHDDPAYVQGVMIATARNAEEIKKEAGIKATGRKATAGAVFSYSIQWHPDGETIPDRAGMIEIAEQTLKIFGAENHQAAIICHTDRAHPHVHIVVNRVDPSTGKMLVLDKNAYRLDDWAAKYERDRGQIVSPNRDAKHEARKRKAKAAEQSPAQQAFTQTAQPAPAPAAQPDARPEVATANQPEPLPAQSPRPKTRAAILFERQQAQKVRHKQEWADLSAANKTRRAEVYGERIDFKAIAAEHRATTRPDWSELGKVQAAERKVFRDREKRLSGIVRNAIDVVRNQQIRGVGDDRGFLTMAFAYTINGQARRAAFDARQQETKDQLAVALNAALQARFTAAKEAQAAKLAAVRIRYDRERAELITRQDLEKARIRDTWREIYAEREKLSRAADRSRERMTRRDAQNYRQGRRLDRQAWHPPIDNQARAPGQHPDATSTARPVVDGARAHVDHRPNFDDHNRPGRSVLPFPTPLQQQEPQPVKSDFDKSAQVPTTNQPAPAPAPTEQVTVTYAAPRLTPDGVPTPPQRTVQTVPKVDRAAEYAAQQAKEQGQKPGPEAARDAFRRPYPPAPDQGAAANQDRPGPMSAADFRRNAAAAVEKTPPEAMPAMSAAEFRKNAISMGVAKPSPAPDRDKDYGPQPSQ